MDSDYLDAVGDVLAKGIADTCHAKPDDPIEYLAQFLLKSVADGKAAAFLAKEKAAAEKVHQQHRTWRFLLRRLVAK